MSAAHTSRSVNPGAWLDESNPSYRVDTLEPCFDDWTTEDLVDGIGQKEVCGAWGTESMMYSTVPGTHHNNAWGLGDVWGANKHRLIRPPTNLRTTSLRQASVDTSNGALQLQVLRVFSGPGRLMTGTQENGMTSICAFGPSTVAYFRVIGLEYNLVLDGEYQLFIISDQDPDSNIASSSPIVLLALATATSTNNHNVVILQHCCRLYDIHFYTMDELQPWAEPFETPINVLHSLKWVLERLQSALFERPIMLWSSVYDIIYACMFPSDDVTTRDLLSLIISLADLGHPLTPTPALTETIIAVAKSICPGFNLAVLEDCFQLTIKNEAMLSTWKTQKLSRSNGPFFATTFLDMSLQTDPGWLEVNYSFLFSPDKANWTTVRYEASASWVENREWHDILDGHRLPFTVRFPLDYLLSHMQKSELYQAIRYARQFSTLLGEDFQIFMGRSPVPEDDHIFLEGWGPRLTEELGLVWKQEMITIL